MKILFLSHFVPYPPTAGHLQRNFNLIKQISKYNEVDLVTFSQRVLLPTEDKLNQSVEALKDYCRSIQVFRIKTDYSSFAWYGGLLANLVMSKPFTVWKFASAEMRAYLTQLLRENTYDLVHIDSTDVIQYADLVSGIPKALNHHNVESTLLLRRSASQSNPLAGLYMKMQGQKLREYENRETRKVDLNICVSDLDAEEFRQRVPEARFEVVSNGTDVDYFRAESADDSTHLIFAGPMSWHPNRDAMMYFCSEVYPLIKKQRPGVVMDVIGHHPPAALKQLAEKDDSIILHGFVDDVRVYLAKAAVYVVPIRVGGGSRLKILDAMASGKAIVSTAVGCEGLEVTNGENIMIADAPEDFAREVIHVLDDKDLRLKLEKNGRSLVESLYSWERIGAHLNDLYKSIVK